LVGARALVDGDGGPIGIPGVGGPYVGEATAEPDMRSLHRALAHRHLRYDLETPVAEVGPDAQPLVHDRPGGAVVAPRLHEHRAAGPAAVDVGALVGRGEDLRHRARGPAPGP